MHHSLSPLIMTLNHDRVLELGWDGIDYQVLVSISYPTLSWPMIIQLVDQWSSNSTGFWTNRKDKYEGNLLPDPYSNSTVHSVATISLNCFNIINLQLSASISNWLKPNNSQPTAFWVASSRGGSQPWLFKLQVEITVTIDKNHGCKKNFRKFHLFNPPLIPIIGSKMKVVVDLSSDLSKQARERQKANGKSSIEHTSYEKNPKNHPNMPFFKKWHFG